MNRTAPRRYVPGVNTETGPPHGIVGSVVASGEVLGRSEIGAVALVSAAAFPSGVLFEVLLAARRGELSQPEWDTLRRDLTMHTNPGAVRVFVRSGGELELLGGSHGHYGDDLVELRHRLWLDGLPDGPTCELVVRCPPVDVAECGTSLDSVVLREKAAQAQRLW